MRSENFYSNVVQKLKVIKKQRFMRTFFLLSFLAFGVTTASFAAPTFQFASPQSITVCSNGTVDLASYLKVNETNIAATETWSSNAPGNGVILGLPSSNTVDGTLFTSVPSGAVTYTPSIASGTDGFTVTVTDGTHLATLTFIINIVAPPALVLGNNPSVCAGATTATLTYTGLQNAGPMTASYSYTGGAQLFTVPAGVHSINFDAIGASGGNDSYSGAPNPGKGGRVTGRLSVNPGDALNLYVGGKGSDGSATGPDATGGYNGGGNAKFYYYGTGGAGGGATDIRLNGSGLTDRVVVAGGGGGNGWDDPGTAPVAAGARAGGNGGDIIGGNSANNGGGFYAGGGTQSPPGGAPATYPGKVPASAGSLGNGGTSSIEGISGGGGGGYYGGGGGLFCGGGGGSSYTDAVKATLVAHTQGFNTGNGQMIINYNIPTTYNIVWDGVAHTAGFTDVTDALSSSISVSIPSSANPTTTDSIVYNGTLTITNPTCTSNQYPFTITVKHVPNVNPTSDTILCNGSMTPDINFTTTGSTYASFDWTNDNLTIGLSAASGNGHIASFTTTNTTTDPSVANIIVTPSAYGCIGTPDTFQIVDNPIPALNSTTTPPAICNNTPFSYIPGSAVVGTTFDWTRAEVIGISNPASNGAGNPNETLVNTTTGQLAVAYVYTLTANGCSSNATVTVTVNPPTALTSSVTPGDLCDNTLFNYTPAATAPATTFAWSRAAVTGISNAAASGTGNPNETLADTTHLPVGVTYAYTLNIYGCTYNQNVTFNVNPLPVLTTPLTAAPLCDSVLFSYPPASNVAVTTFTWSRAAVAGISNPAASGSGNPAEYLANTTPDPVTVTYVDTLHAYGCINTQHVSVVIKPRPELNSTLAPTAICDSALFSYIPTSLTGGTSFNWLRDTTFGITNIPAASAGGVNEILYSTAANPVNVNYIYTLMANGCTNIDTVKLTVNPTPKLSNPSLSLELCDSNKFVFNPASATTGTSFNWSRAYVSGIFNVAASGTNSPNEYLDNTTYINIPVAYVYTLTANGCSGRGVVDVMVHPTPILSSVLTFTVCSGSPVDYLPVSYTPATSFAWVRPSVTGITPASATGTNSIHETLTSTVAGAVNVMYNYTLTANGCSNSESVKVVVNGAPTVPTLTTVPPTSVCDNTMYQNIGTSTPPPAGMHYTWSADNAQVWGAGDNGQYALINFDHPGTATVYVNVTNGSTACENSGAYTVNVGTSSLASPEVVYFEGQLVCKQTNVDSYQWGWDDAYSLDSNILAGETNQNYTVPSLDVDGKKYWVMIVKDGCTQKAYYNRPVSGVTDVAAHAEEVKVYPNPSNNFINVEVNTTLPGNIDISVFSMLGQKVNMVTTNDHKTRIDVSALPAGYYLVDCVRDGVKIATARFIKN